MTCDKGSIRCFLGIFTLSHPTRSVHTTLLAGVYQRAIQIRLDVESTQNCPTVHNDLSNF